MANTEQIEARLCAYVDGELDAAERAEIEQHLAANPQHRALLEELMAQRQMLRELPRDKAPEDLYDNFQTQLERSVLLGTKGAGRAVAGRLNPWPQIFSIAAVVLLAIGLLAIMSFTLSNARRSARHYSTVSTTLPSATSQPIPEVASGGAPATMMTVAAATPPAAAEAAAAASAPVAVAGAPAPPAALLAPIASNAAPQDIFTSDRTAVASRKNGKVEATGVGALSGLFDAAPLEPEIEQKLKDSRHLPDNCMLVVVAAANPAACDQQVTQYLAQNKIRWDDVPEPMPQPVQIKRSETYASKIQRPQTYELRERAARPMAKGDVPADAMKDQKQQQVAKQAAPSAPQAAPAPAATAAPAPVIAADENRQAAAVPTTQPAAQTRDDGSVAQPLQSQRGAGGFGQATQQIGQDQSYSRNRLIVARNVTRTQLAELNTTIVAQNTGRLSNFRCADRSFTPTTPALAGSVAVQAINQSGAAQQREDLDRQFAGGLKEKNVPAPTQLDASATTTPAPTTAAVAASKPAAPAVGQLQIAAGAAPASQPAAAVVDGGQPVMNEQEKLGSRGVQVQSTSGTTTPLADEAFDVVIVVKPTIAADAVLQAEPAQVAAPAVTTPTTSPTNPANVAPPAALQEKARSGP